jgi:uncharacterized protein YecE (DUF72 family)
MIQKVKIMNEYLIGAGGWAYFQVPGLNSLVAYSKAFDFVEVNSTFYEIPPLREVERWRRLVPHSFHFSVRAHRSITHGKEFGPTQATYESFEKMQQICRVLNAEVLHLEFPASVKIDESFVGGLNEFLKNIEVGRLLLAMEFRGLQGKGLPPTLLRLMQEHGLIHCVDLLKNEVPAYESNVLYSRLFGKGYHNLYQPTDQEIKQVDEISGRYGRVYQVFHGARMYTDAARLKMYRRMKNFPMVTKYTGLRSLEAVLGEDAKFPIKKEKLVRDQGWKLFDMSKERRVRAKDLLQRLPDRTYSNINDVIQTLYTIVGESPIA